MLSFILCVRVPSFGKQASHENIQDIKQTFNISIIGISSNLPRTLELKKNVHSKNFFVVITLSHCDLRILMTRLIAGILEVLVQLSEWWEILHCCGGGCCCCCCWWWWWWWSLLYSAILCSGADSLRSHVILHDWLAFYSAFLNIHRSGVLPALAWLVPHELLPSRRVLCTQYNHVLCHFMQSHIRKVHAYLAVTFLSFTASCLSCTELWSYKCMAQEKGFHQYSWGMLVG